MQDGNYDNRPRSFLVYTPSRTAVVYALAPDDSELVKNETKDENEADTSLECSF